MTDVTLRDAVATDVPAIHGLLSALARHDGVTLHATKAALLRHGFGPRPLFQGIVAERERDVLGIVLFYPDFSTLRGRPGVYVQDLYVTDAARGLGLGRRLLTQALQAGQAWEASYLTLMVDRANVAARLFYDRMGFADRGAYELLILEGAALGQMTAG